MITYDHYPPSDLKSAVAYTVEALTPHLDEFDSIAVRGVSGLIVGSPVSLALGKPLLVVRKPAESSHASTGISNFELAGDTYLILDDFISTGATVAEIQSTMKSMTRASLAGLYMYRDRRYTDQE